MGLDRNSRVIGIDVGGTFGRGIRGALVDGTGSRVAGKEAVTPRTSQEDLIEALAALGRWAQPEGALDMLAPDTQALLLRVRPAGSSTAART